MNRWQRLDDGSDIDVVGYKTIVRKKFRMNNGKVMDADIVSLDNSAGAGVIALTPDNKVVIARQFRCGPEMIMDEIPGGLVEPGEDPKEAARREMVEEVGYDSDDIEYLGTSFASAWDNMARHYFLAKNCYKTASNNPEEFEEIEPDEISITQFIDNAKEGRMTDAQVVLLAYDKLKEMEGSHE